MSGIEYVPEKELLETRSKLSNQLLVIDRELERRFRQGKAYPFVKPRVDINMKALMASVKFTVQDNFVIAVSQFDPENPIDCHLLELLHNKEPIDHDILTLLKMEENSYVIIERGTVVTYKVNGLVII